MGVPGGNEMVACGPTGRDCFIDQRTPPHQLILAQSADTECRQAFCL